MDEKEREFARLQTDVQIWLGFCLGCFASMAAALIATSQERGWWVLVVVLAVLTCATAIKTECVRKKMDDKT